MGVNGDSLQGDGINHGDLVIVEPNVEIIDGKMYVIRRQNEVVARHLYTDADKLKLVSSNEDYETVEATDIEVLGRLILSGRWKKH